MNVKNRKQLTYEQSHKYTDGILYKLCTICNEFYPCNKDYFYKNKASPDGLHPWCKICTVKKSTKYEYENYDDLLNAVSKYNSSPERKKIQRGKANKQRKEGYLKDYQDNNPEKMKEYQQKRKQNKEHTINIEEWDRCKIYFNNCCAYCNITEVESKKKYKQSLHKEHVSHNGSNGIDNCVPSCKGCNSQKWEFTLDEWYNKNNQKFTEERYNKILKWLNEDWKTK